MPHEGFNPYLPAIGRLYDVLAALAPTGETITATNRELADMAGVSAGYVPTLLRQLVRDGHIERITSPTGSLLVMHTRCDQSAINTRSIRDQACVITSAESGAINERSIMVDRSLIAENPLHADGAVLPDRSVAAINARSAMIDPPHTPLYGTGGGSYPTTPLPPTQPTAQPGGGGGVATQPGTPNPDTVALLLGYQPPFSAASVREFGDLPPDVVQRELATARAAGSGPGAIVMRWRLQRPTAPAAASPAQPRPAPHAARRPAPADALSPQEAAHVFARLRQLQQQRLGVSDGVPG